MPLQINSVVIHPKTNMSLTDSCYFVRGHSSSDPWQWIGYVNVAVGNIPLSFIKVIFAIYHGKSSYGEYFLFFRLPQPNLT